MADTRITGLTELAEAPADDDFFVIVDVSDTTMAGTGTNKGVSRTNAFNGFVRQTQTVETVTGTTYSVVAADVGKMKATTNASAVTVTLPTPTSLSLAVGDIVYFRNQGAGIITFAAGAGATIADPSDLSLVMRAQGCHAFAQVTSTTNWALDGGLVAP